MAVAFHLTVNAAALRRVAVDAARRRMLDVTRQVRNRADIYTPVDTGNLRRNNQMRVAVRGTVVLGEVYNPVSYAKAVHDGTRPHVIRPRRKKALRFVLDGEIVIVKSVRHPGTEGRPWLRRALVEVAPRYGFKILPT